MESCEVKSITQQCPGGRGWRMDGWVVVVVIDQRHRATMELGDSG